MSSKVANKKIGYSFFPLSLCKEEELNCSFEKPEKYLQKIFCSLFLVVRNKIICQGQEMRVENKVSADRSIIGFLPFLGLLVHEKTFISLGGTKHKGRQHIPLQRKKYRTFC